MILSPEALEAAFYAARECDFDNGSMMTHALEGKPNE